MSGRENKALAVPARRAQPCAGIRDSHIQAGLRGIGDSGGIWTKQPPVDFCAKFFCRPSRGFVCTKTESHQVSSGGCRRVWVPPAPVEVASIENKASVDVPSCAKMSR